MTPFKTSEEIERENRSEGAKRAAKTRKLNKAKAAAREALAALGPNARLTVVREALAGLTGAAEAYCESLHAEKNPHHLQPLRTIRGAVAEALESVDRSIQNVEWRLAKVMPKAAPKVESAAEPPQFSCPMGHNDGHVFWEESSHRWVHFCATCAST